MLYIKWADKMILILFCDALWKKDKVRSCICDRRGKTFVGNLKFY